MDSPSKSECHDLAIAMHLTQLALLLQMMTTLALAQWHSTSIVPSVYLSLYSAHSSRAPSLQHSVTAVSHCCPCFAVTRLSVRFGCLSKLCYAVSVIHTDIGIAGWNETS